MDRVVKASGGVCRRLLGACLDSAVVKILAATGTLSTPSVILSTARAGGASGLHPGG